MGSESTRGPRLLRQGVLCGAPEPAQAVDDDPEALPPPDRLATSGVVCATCGADVATGEAHTVECDALHGPYCPPWVPSPPPALVERLTRAADTYPFLRRLLLDAVDALTQVDEAPVRSRGGTPLQVVD